MSTSDLSRLQHIIESCYAGNADPKDGEQSRAIEQVIAMLDMGLLRVANPPKGGEPEWKVQTWVKQAILLYFRIRSTTLSEIGDFSFVDKIPVKKWTGKEGVRVVPPAFVRKGAFVASGAILMPSYTNIGAYVDEGTMVDTWATVGSCAQIGKNVHLSGGVGIGGVLEPLQASPVIIEDNVFVGSRCIIVEGAQIGQGAVLGAGTVITASTKILDVSTPELKTYKGHVPKNSVVIPGTTEKEFPAGKFQVPCALIIGQRSEKTDKKTSLNDVLRDFHVPV